VHLFRDVRRGVVNDDRLRIVGERDTEAIVAAISSRRRSRTPGSSVRLR